MRGDKVSRADDSGDGPTTIDTPIRGPAYRTCALETGREEGNHEAGRERAGRGGGRREARTSKLK